MARLAYVKFNSTTYMQGLLDLMESELPKHGGWEAVDTVNSPGAMPCRVWRCKGTTNPTGKDWYLYIARLTANPQALYVAISEGYNSTTKGVIRPAPGANMSSVTPASDYSYGGGTEYTVWTGTSGSTLNQADIYWATLNAATQANDNWLVISNVALYHWGSLQRASNSSNTGFYAGSVEKLDPASPDLYVVGDWLSSSADQMRGTRHPSVTTAQTNNWVWQAPAWASAAWTPFFGQMNGAGDRFWNGRPIGGRRCVRTGRGAPANYGELYALYPGILAIDTLNSTSTSDSVSPGDTTQIPRLDNSGVSDTFAYAWRYNTNQPLWVDITQA